MFNVFIYKQKETFLNTIRYIQGQNIVFQQGIDEYIYKGLDNQATYRFEFMIDDESNIIVLRISLEDKTLFHYIYDFKSDEEVQGFIDYLKRSAI